MRKPPLMPTKRHRVIPCAVLIGGNAELRDACRTVVARAAAARLEACGVEDAATTVASCRPFALIVPDVVYGFDPAEFDALARAVGASLVQIPAAGMSAEGADALLVPRLRAAFEKKKT
ncbi:MAG: hypothetical protein KC776_23985 [Myxococcales bacterium]|nr:hypothetical protein [Myxococcales bacterium]MCB9578492.1 hypothetical protein [Polyangiaceae bacterium]